MLRTIWQIVPTLRLLALILLGLQCAPGLADNVMAELEVVKVMERRGTIPGFGGADVALLDNRDDTVLVLATNGNDEPGLFLYDGTYTPVVSAGQVLPGAPGPFTGYWIAGVMNATTVVFLGSFANGGSAIYRYDRASGHYTPVVASGAAVPGGSGHFSAFFGLAVDDDRVIFMATATDGSRGIYRWDGALTPLVDYTTTVPGGTGTFSFFTGLAARDGIVAIGGRDVAGRLGIYRSENGGPLARVADTTTTVPGTTETFEHLDVAGIHDGEVYFTGFGGFVAGVYGGVQATTTVVDTRQPMPGAFGPFDCCFGNVHRSAPGAYYFKGTNFGTYGIYLARDGKVYRVIDSDEPLDGTRLDYLQPSGNWSGAQSSNGRVYFETTGGIYAAHPSFAPAPAAAPRITLGFEDLDPPRAPVTAYQCRRTHARRCTAGRPAPPDTAFPGDDAGTGDMLTAPSPDGALPRIIFDAPARGDARHREHPFQLDLAVAQGHPAGLRCRHRRYLARDHRGYPDRAAVRCG